MNEWDKLNEQMRRDNEAASRQRQEETRARNETSWRQEQSRNEEHARKMRVPAVDPNQAAPARQPSNNAIEYSAPTLETARPLTLQLVAIRSAIAGVLLACAYAFLALNISDGRMVVWGLQGAVVGLVSGAGVWLLVKALHIAVRILVYLVKVSLAIGAVAIALYVAFEFFSK